MSVVSCCYKVPVELLVFSAYSNMGNRPSLTEITAPSESGKGPRPLPGSAFNIEYACYSPRLWHAGNFDGYIIVASSADVLFYGVYGSTVS